MEAEDKAASTSSTLAETHPTSVKTQKVRPIVISKQKFWLVSRELIQQRKIQIRHCITQTCKNRWPSGNYLDENKGNPEYHSFKFPEVKTLRTALRGIPQNLSTNKLKQNLIDAEFEVISFARMHNTIEGARTDLPFILVQLANKNIFKLTKLGKMLIKAEPQKAKNSIP